MRTSPNPSNPETNRRSPSPRDQGTERRTSAADGVKGGKQIQFHVVKTETGS